MEQNETNLKWLHRAAENGNLSAQYRLGLCYYYGKHGFEVNEKLGLEWLIRAGKGGYKKAQKKLVEIAPTSYFSSDPDINEWLRIYNPSEYDRQCEIHQMML